MKSLREKRRGSQLLSKSSGAAQGVMWYDAVTIEGELKWQDTLNDSNLYFFESCDGIFVNYTWRETSLLQAVSSARERLADTFFGIDVFGRGTVGGGGFQCSEAKNLLLHTRSASNQTPGLALFAPGWVIEVI